MPTFTRIDDEVPSRGTRGLRRPAVVAVLAVVVVGGCIGGWAIDRAVAGGSSSAGSILVRTSSGEFALVQPDGTRPQPFASLGFVGGTGAYVSPDHKLLVTESGDTVTLENGRPVTHSTALYGPLSVPGQGLGIGAPAPFADGSADVVYSASFDAATQSNKVMIVSADGTDPRDLGTGNNFAGDPQQPAAFVTVPADRSAVPPAAQAPVDSAIEHHVAGGLPTTVVTAAQITKDLALQGNPALSLSVVPDPTGNKLAVEVQDPSSLQEEGTLVFARNGTLIARSPDVQNGLAWWSPSGNALVFSTKNAIDVWTPGGTPQRVAGPAGAGALGACAWSPDEQRIACAAYPPGGGAVSSWVLIDRKSLTAKGFAVGGMPLLWLK